MHRVRNIFLLPIGFACILILFYALAGALSWSLDSLREGGFVFTPIPVGGAFDAIGWLSATQIDWRVVLEARDEIGALILVCTIGASLATTALEIGAETELEPNRELRAHGVANMACALVGGIPAFTLVGPSLTYLRLGASSRLMPILRAEPGAWGGGPSSPGIRSQDDGGHAVDPVRVRSGGRMADPRSSSPRI